MSGSITQRLGEGVVVGDGGYLIELERRGYVDSGSGREKVGTGKGSGQFTPEVAIEHPAALAGLHAEFLRAGAQVLQALTFFATREKLTRAGYGAETEAINAAAVRIAREAAADRALVAGSISRTQLFEREGPSAAGHVRDLFEEQVQLLQAAGVDFLILETFFRLDEMLIALECGTRSGLPIVATMSFRPVTTQSADGHPPAECARRLATAGAVAVGANCEQEPARMLPILRAMRAAVAISIAAQPAAFRTTEQTPCFTRSSQFPDDLEEIQVARSEFCALGARPAGKGSPTSGAAAVATQPISAPWQLAWRRVRDAADDRHPDRFRLLRRQRGQPRRGGPAGGLAHRSGRPLPGRRRREFSARRLPPRGRAPSPFPDLHVFALDEYVGIPPHDTRTCANLLRRVVADAWGIPADRYHALSGRPHEVAASIREHEEKLVRIATPDVTVLGLGPNGHLGFNEPGSTPDSAGRVVDLEPASVEANARWFNSDYAPSQGVTLGLRAILSGAARLARRLRPE